MKRTHFVTVIYNNRVTLFCVVRITHQFTSPRPSSEPNLRVETVKGRHTGTRSMELGIKGVGVLHL